MPLHIRREITKEEVPVELIRLAFAHLESAEKLNSLMNDSGLFSHTLQRVRGDFERIATILFVDPPANPALDGDTWQAPLRSLARARQR